MLQKIKSDFLNGDFFGGGLRLKDPTFGLMLKYKIQIKRGQKKEEHTEETET